MPRYSKTLNENLCPCVKTVSLSVKVSVWMTAISVTVFPNKVSTEHKGSAEHHRRFGKNSWNKCINDLKF